MQKYLKLKIVRCNKHLFLLKFLCLLQGFQAFLLILVKHLYQFHVFALLFQFHVYQYKQLCFVDHQLDYIENL